MWRFVVPWVGLLLCSAVILIQRTTITNLQPKDMHRMCLQKRYSGNEVQLMDHTLTTSTTTANRKSQRPRFRSERKRCSSEVTFSDPKLIGVRPNSVGAAMRDGHAYYVTEFDLGYSILPFLSARSLNQSEPKSIVTLPYPFHGTDNTVFNGTAYYDNGDMVIAFNMKTGDTKELHLDASKNPLYNNSMSRLDVQADEHGLWLLYRRKEEDFLTVSRVQPTSLKVLSNWSLPAILPQRLCNALIRCGLLYTVICDIDHVTATTAYDFYAHMYVNGKQTRWRGVTSLSSVQYDPTSKSITIFDTGSIYAVSAG